MKALFSIGLALTLAACQSSDEHAAVAAADAGCEPVVDNLLTNPEFSNAGDGSAPLHWQASQHAGALAFTISAAGGELVIDKHGEQHWMLIKQLVKPESVAGQRVRFSAEMSQDMTDEGWTQSLEAGGGFSISVFGTEPDAPLRQKLLFNSNLQHQPKLGVFDWTPVSVEFDVAAGVTKLEVGFLHQAYGQMRIRNPVLSVITEQQSDCQ